MTAAHDVGRAINPTLIEGQIEGGVAQGLGMALMEEFFPGRARTCTTISFLQPEMCHLSNQYSSRIRPRSDHLAQRASENRRSFRLRPRFSMPFMMRSAYAFTRCRRPLTA